MIRRTRTRQGTWRFIVSRRAHDPIVGMDRTPEPLARPVELFDQDADERTGDGGASR